MARKDRAPNPPKKPQAPQRRSTPSGPRDAQRRRLLYILAATGLVGLAIVLGVVFLTGGGDKDLAATMESAGCQLKTVQAQVGNHSAAENATSNPKWNTDPPTSGPHFPVPAVYGEYDSPLKPAQFVHNLEHGAVFVLYGPKVPAATVTQLSDFYNEDTTGMLLAPYPKLGDKIALGAWTSPAPGSSEIGTGHLAKCTAVNKGAFEAFLSAFRGRGPENGNLDLLQPGGT